MKISKKILQLSQHQKFTKKKIQECLGVSPQGHYDKMKKNYFKNTDLEKLAKLFGVDVGYFFGAEELEMIDCYKIPIKVYVVFFKQWLREHSSNGSRT